MDWKIVFINDGSTDDTLAAIRALREETDSRVKVISLSRNFGYHSVLVASLTSRESDLYCIIDVDCEDPPELIEKFYEEIKNGAQTAYGDRSRRDEPGWLVFWRRLFYYINRWIADAPIKLWMAEFSMITRLVRDAILKSRTTYPFLRAQMGYVGYKMAAVPYLHASRHHGVSHYNFLSMTRFAVAGFLSYAFGGFFLLWSLLVRPGLLLEGAMAAVLSLLFLLLSMPMIALYLARTYKDVSGRPIYFIDPDSAFL